MPIVTVKVPGWLLSTGHPTALQCEGETVREVLADLCVRLPVLRSNPFSTGGDQHLMLAPNGRVVPGPDGPETATEEGDNLIILPPISGG